MLEVSLYTALHGCRCCRRSHLSVCVKDQLPLEGQLWKDIRADESGWLIDKEANQRCIIITLIKRDAGRL